jgi:hypothetical protein
MNGLEEPDKNMVIFTLRSSYLQENRPRYILDMKPGVPLIRSGRCVEEKNLGPAGIRTPTNFNLITMSVNQTT